MILGNGILCLLKGTIPIDLYAPFLISNFMSSILDIQNKYPRTLVWSRSLDRVGANKSLHAGAFAVLVGMKVNGLVEANPKP